MKVVFAGEDRNWAYEWVDGEVCLGGTYFKRPVRQAYACPYSRVLFVEDAIIPPPQDDALDMDF